LGYTPLLLALSGGTIDIAEMLINKGADVSARTRKGETPLSLAQQAQCTEIVELLISKGAKT
ncbi:MAG: ankyrin repeat domain-containing protein, partial [Rhodoferax sp.]|nr:ankyrin repeat domain-containing protein [Rhodoferax sp.]